MLPTAGLFLPDTLHRNHDANQEEPDTRSINRRYFGGKTKLFDRKSSDRKSATSARRSSEDVSSAFSSLSTVFNFVDFALSRNDVSADNQVFVNLVHRVRHDLIEAIRLRSCPAVLSYYELYPEKETRIDQILLDVQKALNDIGAYMENVRVSGDYGGSIGLKNKFEWVLGHHQKLQTRQGYLSVCHQSLMATIPLMQQLEMSGVQGSFELEGAGPNNFEAPNRPWLYDEGGGSVLHGPQKWRYSQRNSSLPSILVSEHEGEKSETQHIYDIPVELQGSTPDDLPDPENWDLYVPPPKIPQESFDHGTPQKPLAQVHPSTSLDQRQPITSLYRAQSREPFDQVRPRAFSDQIRPRASADQIRPRPSLEEYKSRPSSDHISPLPRLVEKVARNDSSASISDAAPISLQAKRYRSRAVNVRKPPTRNHFLPPETQLPYIPAQSSLIMELSQWVLPGSHANNVSNNTYDTPSTSITSSPVVPASPTSLAGIARPVPSVKSMTTLPVSSLPSVSTNVLPSPDVLSRLSYGAQSFPPIDSTRPTASMTSSPTSSEAQKSPPSSIRSRTSITRRPVPVSGAQNLNESKVQQPNLDITSPLERHIVENTQSKLQSIVPEQSVLKASSTTDLEFQKTTTVAVALKLATGVKPTSPDNVSRATSSDQRDASHMPGSVRMNAPASDVGMTGSKYQATNASIPTVPMTNNSPGSVVALDGPRPMMAQSKRRAAHARRMQLAYGSG